MVKLLNEDNGGYSEILQKYSRHYKINFYPSAIEISGNKVVDLIDLSKYKKEYEGSDGTEIFNWVKEQISFVISKHSGKQYNFNYSDCEFDDGVVIRLDNIIYSFTIKINGDFAEDDDLKNLLM